MLAIAFTFLAGRYHATPWGRHVNEADVAWPPDLWRISRALIAVWHRKIDATAYPAQRVQSLLARLVEAPAPSYRLPEVAIHSHTRHFMPGKADKKTLVFDAFARVASDSPLIIAWPHLTLDSSDVDTLDTLLDNLGFLGRAESWVEARRVDWPGSFNCAPAGQAVDDETGELQGEIVRLLAPQSPETYAALRLARLASAAIKPDAPFAKLKGDKKKLAATLPSDWLDGIGVDTGDLQAAGWSAPPCATTVSYLRPLRALQTTAPRVTSRRIVVTGPRLATTARFVLYGKPLPRLQDAVRVGEALRRGAMGVARRLLGPEAVPPELSGHELSATNRHGHAFWLPEDADGDGAIDHLLVHAPDGFSNDALRVLTALRTLRRDDDVEPLRLLLEGVGASGLFGQVSSYARLSKVWRSATPYLHPWHLKKPDLQSLEATMAAVARQLRKEWALRGEHVAAIESVVERTAVDVGGGRLEPLHFQRMRRKRGLTQPDTLGRMLELRFAEPVRGPLALGYGCHFGLGLFRDQNDLLTPSEP